MLTRKQYDLLMFIHKRMRSEGVSPSFDEMKEALDLRSKSGVHRLITALEERGFIRRLAHRARAIEILKLPENFTARPSGGFQPSVISGDLDRRPEGAGRPSRAVDVSTSNARDIPVVGRIAAGAPLEALEDASRHIGAPSVMLSANADHYALEVKGDSMIDAGIFDGDVVVLEKQDSARNGDIVAALIDDHEATLKRLRRRGGAIALEAANPAFETRVYGADQVKVQGRLVGLIRTY